jgi:hypothetical protein
MRNYKIYKETIKDLRNPDGSFQDSVALYEVNNLKNPKMQFIVVCFEDPSRAVKLFAWELD